MSNYTTRPPVLFGLNYRQTLTDSSIQQEDSICKEIQFYCCIGLTFAALMYLITMIILIIIFEPYNSVDNQNDTQHMVIEGYLDSTSGSLSYPI
jgi:hypothetical protein